MPFISFSCLTTQARTSKYQVEQKWWSGHPCLSLDLSTKWLGLSPAMCNASCSISAVPFTRVRKFSSIPSLLSFYQEWRLCFFLPVYWHVICQYNKLHDWFLNVKPALHSGNELHLVMMYYSTVRFNLLKFSLEFLQLCSRELLIYSFLVMSLVLLLG